MPFFGIIIFLVYLAIIVYLVSLATRLVNAFERIAKVAETVPPRIAGALERIAENTEPKP